MLFRSVSFGSSCAYTTLDVNPQHQDGISHLQSKSLIGDHETFVVIHTDEVHCPTFPRSLTGAMQLDLKFNKKKSTQALPAASMQTLFLTPIWC